MNLQEFFSEFCERKATLRIQCGIKSGVTGRIVISEDDFIVLRLEEKILSKETVIPHSAIRTVVEVDEMGNPKLFVPC